MSVDLGHDVAINGSSHRLARKNAEPNETQMNLEKLNAQLQTLEDIDQRLRFELRQSSNYGDDSDSNSVHFSNETPYETETPPPGLTTSHCSTPSNAEISTPHNGAKLPSYFPLPLSGVGKARVNRVSSPLATDCSTTPSSDRSSSGLEEVPRPSALRISSPPNRKSHQASFHHASNNDSDIALSQRISSIPFSSKLGHVPVDVSSQVDDAPLQQPRTRPRSASLSVLGDHIAKQVRPRERRSSLPGPTGRDTLHHWLRDHEPQREIVLPSRPKPIRPGHKPLHGPEDDIEIVNPSNTNTAAVAKPVDIDLEKQLPTDGSQDSRASVWSRAKTSFVATYCPTATPTLILPTAPTDTEKLLYLKTNRFGLYTFGLVSFFSLSAGMWLFVISSSMFYWFGLFVGLLQIYLIISYTVSMCGKDYDYTAHQKIVEENPIDRLTAPTIDIYLPCCKEPIEVLENTYKHVRELKWPEGKLKVYVLDDGASEAVQEMARQYGFSYICREDRPRLKKAGNLRWAFARTEGDFFAIFDADFCPRADFLHEIMPIHLAKHNTAIVQTPQFFRISDDQTWIEQGAGAVQELFYRVVQINRNRWGASICVGSNAVYRREALVETGGTAEIGFSEDVHTGFYAVNRGWKVRYLPLCLACGICPDTPRAFFSQQMRWCMGSTTLLTNPDFWRSNLNPIQKICYLSGMMYYSAISLSIFISPLPGILMLWIRPDYVRYYNLAFAVPSIVYSLIAMRCWAKASYGFNVQHVMVIQSYAYLTAIKDRLFGRALAWVPSGDTKAHKNNKYRNMRLLAICWTLICLGLLVAGTTWQLLREKMEWYDTLPLILLTTLNLYLSHRFLFWSGKI